MRRVSSIRRVLLAVVVAACGVVLMPATASAQTAEERETARTTFEQGKTLRDRGDMEGALEAFKAADALMNVPTTKLALARAYAAVGKLVEARDAALKIEHIPITPKEPQPFADARASAAPLAAELAERIPQVQIVLVGAPPGDRTAVTVDGVEVPPAALAAPRRLNPGKHVVLAKIGDGEVRGDVEVAEKESKKVTLDVTAIARADALAAKKSATPDPSTPREEPLPKRGLSPLVWAGLGVAVVGIGVGSIAGVASMGARSDADASCRDGRCPPEAHASLDSANQWATISTVGFIGAGVGVAVAAVGFLVAPGGGATKKAARVGPQPGTRVTPFLSATGAGVSGRF